MQFDAALLFASSVVHRVEQHHFKATGDFHDPKVRSRLLGERNLLALFRVRRAEADPASDPDIVEDLEEPFHFRREGAGCREARD